MHVRPYVRARADKRPDVTCGGVWGYIDSSANSKTISVNFSAGTSGSAWAGAADTGVPGTGQTPVAAVLLGLRDHPGALTLATSGSSSPPAASRATPRASSHCGATPPGRAGAHSGQHRLADQCHGDLPGPEPDHYERHGGPVHLSATNAGLSSTSNLDEVAFLFANWDPARVWTHADGGQSRRLTRNLVSASASLSASVNWGSFLVELLPKVA